LVIDTTFVRKVPRLSL